MLLRTLCALTVTLGSTGGPLAADCLLAAAIYGQRGTDWVLEFSKVPHDAPTNQHNAFTIRVPGTDKAVEGAVYSPNGFNQAWGLMQLGCPEGGEGPGCSLWEGVVYAGGSQGIIELPHETEAPPAQLLFPHFARGLWYSIHPEIDFRAIVALDTFDFKGCGASG